MKEYYFISKLVNDAVFFHVDKDWVVFKNHECEALPVTKEEQEDINFVRHVKARFEMWIEKNKKPQDVSDLLSGSEGIKADQDKPRLDLIPPEVIFGYGRALRYGASKYSDRNFEKGMAWGRVFGAAMRHLWAFWMGEEYDKESGLHHLESALFSVAALYVYTQRKIGKDDRKLGS